MGYCYLAHQLRLKRSGKFPFVINFELWNECNANCVFCRSANGEIYDQNPKAPGRSIAKGRMPWQVYAEIIDQVKDYLLMAILYINGEPLLYKDIDRAIKYASDKRIATMISTNGILLNESNIKKLLGSGLDFLKVAISGFSQETYGIEVRRGEIEKIKDNLRLLARLNEAGRHGLLVMLDFIHYTYNAHEIETVRQFCQENGFVFNLRPGITTGLKGVEPVQPPKKNTDKLCDWPWKVLSINWNGDIFPCCNYVLWSEVRPYARFELGRTRVAEVWNGSSARAYRAVHIEQGRKGIPICADCTVEGVYFKY